jgi:predicted small lipoprotein YifL
MPPPIRQTLLSACLVLVCACLAGCGQTGPLYIPQEEPPATTPEPAPAT